MFSEQFTTSTHLLYKIRLSLPRSGQTCSENKAVILGAQKLEIRVVDFKPRLFVF